MNSYTIYTDGSCKGVDERHGGWSAIICNESGEIIKELYGGFTHTTSPRMEIRGVLEGLKAIKDPSIITVVSDSQYVVNTINDNWIGRIIENPESFSNTDLWFEMVQLLQYHKVTMIWTKGHADNEMNNRADRLAQFVAKALNLPKDEYINNSKETREPLVSELKTRWSNGFNTGQENGVVLYSLG